MQEPLDQSTVRRLIRQILDSGKVIFSRHAELEMKKDNLSPVQCIRVLRGGIVEPAEWEHGSWRYRVHTASICVVCTFRDETALIVVTAWKV